MCSFVYFKKKIIHMTKLLSIYLLNGKKNVTLFALTTTVYLI